MKKIIHFLSRRNWGIIRYNTIFRNLIALLYLCIASDSKDITFLGRTALFFLFSVVMTGYGYFVNDLADLDIDIRQGKPNAFLKIPPAQSRFIVFGILALGLVLALPFIQDTVFLIVLILWILISSFYSLKPLRFKERGIWGLVATILAEYTLPIILLFSVFHQAISFGALFFTLYSTIRGTSANLSHQLTDYTKDVETQTTTFAVQKGYGFVRDIYPYFLEIERLLLGTVIGMLVYQGSQLPFSPRIGIVLVLPLVMIYLFLIRLTIGRSLWALKAGRFEEYDPYNEVRQTHKLDALHLIHHSFPSVLLPLYLACIASINYWPNLVFILMIVLIFGLYRPEFLARLHPKNLAIYRTR